MTIGDAIQNGLAFIEASHGHKDGDVYQDLLQALNTIPPDLVNEDMPERPEHD